MGNTIQELIKQSKFESPQQMAYINLYYTYYHFHDLHCSILKPFDLLPQHYNILKIVKGKHPEAVTPGHILEVMLDKKRPDSFGRQAGYHGPFKEVSKCRQQEVCAHLSDPVWLRSYSSAGK